MQPRCETPQGKPYGFKAMCCNPEELNDLFLTVNNKTRPV